jgi:predicted small lipoprotein YifL
MLSTLILFVVLAVFHMYTQDGQAAYLLRFKNGNTIVTSHYWQEGKHIKFFAYGGTLTVESNLISIIEPTSRVPSEGREGPLSLPQAEVKPQVAPLASPEAEVKTQSDKEKQKNIAIPEAKKKDEEIVKEFRQLQERFAGLNDLTIVEVYRLRDDFNFLKRSIVNGGLADVHSSEIDGANTLLSAIEGWLKAR